MSERILLEAKESSVWDQEGELPVAADGSRCIGWSSSQAFPSTFYKPKLALEDQQPDDGTLTCHGDDFLAEGSTAVLDELGDLLNGAFETKTFDYVGPKNPGELAYLKRTVGYTDQLPESNTAGFYWCANGKMIEDLIEKKGYKKSSKVPGTKATGEGSREIHDAVDVHRAKEASATGGLVLYISSDRPDLQYSAKTAMGNASRPTGLMETRLSRQVRYLMEVPKLWYCYELQATPEEIESHGDSDWASKTSEQRKSTTGAAIIFGSHLLDTASVSQATPALSSGEAEFYALGSATARGMQVSFF